MKRGYMPPLRGGSSEAPEAKTAATRPPETRGEQLAGQIVRMGVDNSGAVFNALTGKGEGQVRVLMQRLAEMQGKHNFDMLGAHMDREKNKLSDMPTRFLQAAQLEG